MLLSNYMLFNFLSYYYFNNSNIFNNLGKHNKIIISIMKKIHESPFKIENSNSQLSIKDLNLTIFIYLFKCFFRILFI